jgi:hypothetical protein
VVATSAELRRTVYRTIGAGGGRFGFRRRTLRRVVVVFFFVWASMSGGVTAHTVSAARMAILIFRENIYPFINCDCQLLDETASMARTVPFPTVKHDAVNLRLAWNIPRGKVFSPNNTGVLPRQENEWLSGTTIFCAKA